MAIKGRVRQGRDLQATDRAVICRDKLGWGFGVELRAGLGFGRRGVKGAWRAATESPTRVGMVTVGPSSCGSSGPGSLGGTSG